MGIWRTEHYPPSPRIREARAPAMASGLGRRMQASLAAARSVRLDRRGASMVERCSSRRAGRPGARR
jgi:hypothetical protein